MNPLPGRNNHETRIVMDSASPVAGSVVIFGEASWDISRFFSVEQRMVWSLASKMTCVICASSNTFAGPKQEKAEIKLQRGKWVDRGISTFDSWGDRLFDRLFQRVHHRGRR